MLYGTGGTGAIPLNTKLGGLVIIQADDPTTPIFNYNDFGETKSSYTMTDLYGN